ncbi:MAG: hypothetical protein ACI4TA_01645 [Acetatifactor sp.]
MMEMDALTAQCIVLSEMASKDIGDILMEKGASVLLDATTNTGIQQAENSRMGLWLRYSDINSAGRANQHLVYYRGVSEVARK